MPGIWTHAGGGRFSVVCWARSVRPPRHRRSAREGQWPHRTCLLSCLSGLPLRPSLPIVGGAAPSPTMAQRCSRCALPPVVVSCGPPGGSPGAQPWGFREVWPVRKAESREFGNQCIVSARSWFVGVHAIAGDLSDSLAFVPHSLPECMLLMCPKGLFQKTSQTNSFHNPVHSIVHLSPLSKFRPSGPINAHLTFSLNPPTDVAWRPGCPVCFSDLALSDCLPLKQSKDSCRFE